MRFTLSVTPTTLPRLEALRLAARPTGGKPPAIEIPEADAARDASLSWDEPRPPPGRWLVRSIGPGEAVGVVVDVEPFTAPPLVLRG